MTAVDPRTLQPGDRFRVTTTYEGVVARLPAAPGHEWLLTHEARKFNFEPNCADQHTRTWELLDRPRKPLTVWRDPKTNAEYVLLRSGCYVNTSDACGLLPTVGYWAPVIARLVPAEDTQ